MNDAERTKLSNERQAFYSLLAKANGDALIMALRLYGEPDESMSPECAEVMARWRPKCKALIENQTP